MIDKFIVRSGKDGFSLIAVSGEVLSDISPPGRFKTIGALLSQCRALGKNIPVCFDNGEAN